MMTAEVFRKTMIDVMTIQKSYFDDADDEYAEGIIRGLNIAIEKLNDSSFLTVE